MIVRIGSCFLLLGLLVLSSINVAAKDPQPEILGIRLGMSREQAQARLQRIGVRLKEERKRQEVWSVKDTRISHLLIGYDPDHRVRYVTAIIHSTAGMRYDEVANLENAQRTNTQGNHRVIWELKSRVGPQRFLLIAHGHDQDRLESYSVKVWE
jgi:hypothetical protein